MAKGRFKGWRSESTIAKMTPDEQKTYYAFVEEVKKCRELGKELPEPPVFSTDKKEEPSNEPKKRGRKPGSKNKVKAIPAEKNGTPVSSASSENSATPTNTRNWWDENPSLSDLQETVIHHCSREGFCIIETNELYWIRKLKKLHEKYPELVLYQYKYCKEDTVRVKIPYRYMKRVNIIVRNPTEEQEQTLRHYERDQAEAAKEEEFANDFMDEEDDIPEEEEELDDSGESLDEDEINGENEETEAVNENVEASILPPNHFPNSRDVIDIDDNEESETEIPGQDTTLPDSPEDEEDIEEDDIPEEEEMESSNSSKCEVIAINHSQKLIRQSKQKFTVADCNLFKEMVNPRGILGFPKTTVDEW